MPISEAKPVLTQCMIKLNSVTAGPGSLHDGIGGMPRGIRQILDATEAHEMFTQ